MYLGVHFLSDVLGGYLVGLMWVAIGIVLAEVMRARPAAAPIVPQLASRLKIILSIALIVAATAFYVSVGLALRAADWRTVGALNAPSPILAE